MQSTSFSPLSSPIPLLVCQPSSSTRLHGISHPTRKGTLTPPFSLLALPMRPALRSLAFGPPSHHRLWRRRPARSRSSCILSPVRSSRQSIRCPFLSVSLCCSVCLCPCVSASLFLSVSVPLFASFGLQCSSCFVLLVYMFLFACLLNGLPYYTCTYFTPSESLLNRSRWLGVRGWGATMDIYSVQRERVCL